MCDSCRIGRVLEEGSVRFGLKGIGVIYCGKLRHGSGIQDSQRNEHNKHSSQSQLMISPWYRCCPCFLARTPHTRREWLLGPATSSSPSSSHVSPATNEGFLSDSAKDMSWVSTELTIAFTSPIESYGSLGGTKRT